MKIDLNYNIVDDISFFLEAEKKTLDDLSKESGIARNTLYAILKGGRVSPSICEKLYSFIYSCGYRINAVKEELLKESKQGLILFHGSKQGLEEITPLGSRKNCDFGNGFYLGESYDGALSFVFENEESSVYSFFYQTSNLVYETFDCSLDWMIAICYYRGYLKGYEGSSLLRSILHRVQKADVIKTPIADNRMFYIMSLFANGDINSSIALHSLSASKLGFQYVLRTEKAISNLRPIEKYYLCEVERKECEKRATARAEEIETKLKMAKRVYQTGTYIEELLK